MGEAKEEGRRRKNATSRECEEKKVIEKARPNPPKGCAASKDDRARRGRMPLINAHRVDVRSRVAGRPLAPRRPETTQTFRTARSAVVPLCSILLSNVAFQPSPPSDPLPALLPSTASFPSTHVAVGPRETPADHLGLEGLARVRGEARVKVLGHARLPLFVHHQQKLDRHRALTLATTWAQAGPRRGEGGGGGRRRGRSPGARGTRETPPRLCRGENPSCGRRLVADLTRRASCRESARRGTRTGERARAGHGAVERGGVERRAIGGSPLAARRGPRCSPDASPARARPPRHLPGISRMLLRCSIACNLASFVRRSDRIHRARSLGSGPRSFPFLRFVCLVLAADTPRTRQPWRVPPSRPASSSASRSPPVRSVCASSRGAALQRRQARRGGAAAWSGAQAVGQGRSEMQARKMQKGRKGGVHGEKCGHGKR